MAALNTERVIISLMVMTCYLMASSIARDQVETNGANRTPVLVADAAENADIATDTQYYRPYNNRPSYYNAGYNNRRPFYPVRPSYNTNYQQQQRPVYNNRPAASNNNKPNYALPHQPVASSNSNARGACGVTNGVYEQWGVCWNYQTRILEISKSKVTPDSFGQFYRFMSKDFFHGIPTAEWVRSVCQAATIMLKNQVVMCAPEDHCMNERGTAYYEKYYNEVCVCLIDDRYAPSDSEIIQNMSSMLPAWVLPHAIAGLQLVNAMG